MDHALVVMYDINDRETVLIDSGLSESPELIGLLKARGKRAAAVLCTHFHIDHMGNNGLLQRRMGTKIYASALEIEVQKRRFESDEGSSFEGMTREKYFFGESGRYTSKAIRNDQDSVSIGGKVFRVERLAGHSPDHLGFATPDGVLHVGDAFMTDRVLRHSKVPYELNITKTLDTLRKAEKMDYTFYAASHRGIIGRDEITPTLRANRDYHLRMLDEIESMLGYEWENMHNFVMDVIERRGVRMKLSRNSGWIPGAVRSYIDHLVHEGRVEIDHEDDPAAYYRSSIRRAPRN